MGARFSGWSGSLARATTTTGGEATSALPALCRVPPRPPICAVRGAARAAATHDRFRQPVEILPPCLRFAPFTLRMRPSRLLVAIATLTQLVLVWPA